MATLPQRRPLPECCFACESRTVRRHCSGKDQSRCYWVRCLRCEAVSSYWLDPRKGWRRAFYRLGPAPRGAEA